MRYSIIGIIAALGLAAGGAALARQQPPQTTMPPQQEAQPVEVGDEEVLKFAEIFVGIEQTRARVSRDMAEAGDRQQAQEIQARAQDEIVALIEEHGWSIAQFNQVANAINNDPELRQQAVDHIKEMTAT